MDSTTGGPIVRFSKKCPSITSRWSMRAPPRSTRAISSARRAKSADRMEGTISIIYGLTRFYHSGVEPVAGVAAWKTLHLLYELRAGVGIVWSHGTARRRSLTVAARIGG